MCWKKIFRETRPDSDARIASRPWFQRLNGPAQGRAETVGAITLRGTWVCGKTLICSCRSVSNVLRVRTRPGKRFASTSSGVSTLRDEGVTFNPLH